ncbi:MAG: hypothetical protein SPE78_01465 [Actinobacillus minor]|nr:hypothetical protein [Actinobacillus minor]
MANFKKEAIWHDEIHQLSRTDPVVGGEHGVSNKAPKQLADRTEFLNKRIDNLNDAITAPDGYRVVGQVESIAELRTIEPVEHNQHILVRSYYDGGNKGGGVFYADFADTTTTDNGGTVIVTNSGKRWLRIHTQAVVEEFGAVADKVNDDTDAFLRAADYAKAKKLPFVAQGKYKLTQILNLREIEVQAASCDILLEDGGQIILGGHANSGFNPVQTLGKVMVAKLVLDPAPYTQPTVRIIGAKNQVITVKSTNYIQFYMSTDPETFPRDASIAYSTFNFNFVLKLEIATDPRFDNGKQVDGAGGANQWCNENIFNLNRCWALIIAGSYRHNCNYFIGGSFEGAKSYIDVQTGNKNQFIHTRLESVGWVRFGVSTEGNVLSRSYFSSISRLALNVDDRGILNRIETESLNKSRAVRVLDINPFTVRFNNGLSDVDVSTYIRATKPYGVIAESETFRMVGRKDILIFNADNRAANYQVRVYVYDKSGKPVDLSRLDISSNFLTYVPEFNRLSGTMHGDEEYGVYRLMITSQGEYYAKIVLAASQRKEDGLSCFFTVDLYSDRIRFLSQSQKQQVCLAEPTQYIGFKGDILNYPTGQIKVVEHIQTAIVQKNDTQLTLLPPLTGSKILANDIVGIESPDGVLFWSKIKQVDNQIIELTDDLPEWVSNGDKVYISRFQYPTLRREYSRQIKGLSGEYNDEVIDVVGSVELSPDGRVKQIFHLKNLKYIWFNLDRKQEGTRNIPINFWTAMPNKVTEVRAYSLVGSQPNIIANTEAAEWIVDWALQYQNNSRSYAFINASRFRGGSDELVDLYVVVEGY